MMFIQYDEKGFGFFEAVDQRSRCGGGYRNHYITIRRKLRFDEHGCRKVFYKGELRSFSIASGESVEKDYKKLLDYFKK